jgi:hypothetical protein
MIFFFTSKLQLLMNGCSHLCREEKDISNWAKDKLKSLLEDSTLVDDNNAVIRTKKASLN